jgi:protein ImuB
MSQRYLYLWFRHLSTDQITRRRPALRQIPFVLTVPNHGRKVITAVNVPAQLQGIRIGMFLADAKAILSDLEVQDDNPALTATALHYLALWSVRYTPTVATDSADGLMLDITGCPHLWQGEEPYLYSIINRLKNYGFDVRGTIADTPGAAWAIARYAKYQLIVQPGEHTQVLLSLPPAALRLSLPVLNLMARLGFYCIADLTANPRSALRRRFGEQCLLRLDQAMGRVEEFIEPVQLPEPYSERLPCLEPIVTHTGIEIALARLLDTVCTRLEKEGKGLRAAILKCYRVDDRIIQIQVGTTRPTHRAQHLMKLFAEKIGSIQPDLGIELFILDAPIVEDAAPRQGSLWQSPGGLRDPQLAELLDRVANKFGQKVIERYLPADHHLPEHALQPAANLTDQPASPWPADLSRPFYLLPTPEPIQVTFPTPDYPPMLIQYKNRLLTIKHALGPEQIMDEWWIDKAPYRDYYRVEDQHGTRLWVFRAGPGDDPANPAQWYLHGIFS